ELSLSLFADSDLGVPNAVGAVEMFRKATDLGADVPVGEGVDAGSGDRDRPAVLELDLETARVRAVERTGAGRTCRGGGELRGQGGHPGEFIRPEQPFLLRQVAQGAAP